MGAKPINQNRMLIIAVAPFLLIQNPAIASFKTVATV